MAADQQTVQWTGARRCYALALGRWALGESGRRTPRGAVYAGASSHLMHRLTSLTDEASPAPHLRLPGWLPGGSLSLRLENGVRWFHLVLGAGYTLLYLLVTRLA